MNKYFALEQFSAFAPFPMKRTEQNVEFQWIDLNLLQSCRFNSITKLFIGICDLPVIFVRIQKFGSNFGEFGHHRKDVTKMKTGV